MEVVLLLAVIVGAPIMTVVGVQILIWKLIGVKPLRAVAAVIVLICGYLLVAETFAPPVYGNKSGLVGLGIFAIAILMVENILILFAPLMRQFVAWGKNVEAAHASGPQV